MLINTADIEVNYSTNIRDKLDDDTINTYAEIFDQLPPIVVFEIPECERKNRPYLLSDGFHRYRSAGMIGRAEIEADVRQGTRQDAEEWALMANLRHGKPLTRSERRKAAVRMLILHPERANVWIAEDMAVSDMTVKKYREELESESKIKIVNEFIGRDGKKYPRKRPQKNEGVCQNATRSQFGIVSQNDIVEEDKIPRQVDIMSNWRDNASSTVLECVDKNVFSKDVGKALAKYPQGAQNAIATQLEAMEMRPPNDVLLKRLESLDMMPEGTLKQSFLNGSLRFKYFTNIIDLHINDALDDKTLRRFCDSPRWQEAAFEQMFHKVYALTLSSCIVATGHWSMIEVGKYHPVFSFLKDVAQDARLTNQTTGHPPIFAGISFVSEYDNIDNLKSAFEEAGFELSDYHDYFLNIGYWGTHLLQITSPWTSFDTQQIHPVLLALPDDMAWEISKAGRGFDVRLTHNGFEDKEDFMQWAQEAGFKVEFPQPVREVGEIKVSESQSVGEIPEKEEKVKSEGKPNLDLLRMHNDFQEHKGGYVCIETADGEVKGKLLSFYFASTEEKGNVTIQSIEGLPAATRVSSEGQGTDAAQAGQTITIPYKDIIFYYLMEETPVKDSDDTSPSPLPADKLAKKAELKVVVPEVTTIENEIEETSETGWETFVKYLKWIEEYALDLASAEDIPTVSKIHTVMNITVEKIKDALDELISNAESPF